MSNKLFPKGREGILDDTISISGDVRVMLIKSTYTYDGTDVYVLDLGAVDNGRTETLSGKTYMSGIFNANDTSLTALAAVASNAIILFQHTGNDATARLIAYIDDPMSGLPCTPAIGQMVNLNWDNGVNKIFKL